VRVFSFDRVKKHPQFQSVSKEPFISVFSFQTQQAPLRIGHLAGGARGGASYRLNAVDP
jgi:hypothetical protein